MSNRFPSLEPVTQETATSKWSVFSCIETALKVAFFVGCLVLLTVASFG